jgi:hypothetical protein
MLFQFVECCKQLGRRERGLLSNAMLFRLLFLHQFREWHRIWPHKFLKRTLDFWTFGLSEPDFTLYPSSDGSDFPLTVQAIGHFGLRDYKRSLKSDPARKATFNFGNECCQMDSSNVSKTILRDVNTLSHWLSKIVTCCCQGRILAVTWIARCCEQ